MATWSAALIAVTAITATCFLCVRPLLRGRGHCAGAGNPASDAELDQQVAELREELRAIRARDALEGGSSAPQQAHTSRHHLSPDGGRRQWQSETSSP